MIFQATPLHQKNLKHNDASYNSEKPITMGN